MQTSRIVKDMEAPVEALQKSRVYTLAEITRFMPWAKDGRTMRKILDADMHGPNVLRCEITGTGKGRRYLVQGRHLISYLKIYGPALMSTVRKPKQHARKQGEKREKDSGSRSNKTP